MIAAPASLRGSWYQRYHAITLLAIPLVQLLANRNAFINPAGNTMIDPWVYTGFFLSLPQHLRRFSDTYYATRLPWLVPGFIAHNLLPPVPANYVLHLAFLYALLLAAYCLVASGVNRSAAMIVALLLAWNPTVLAALSWDYVDGAGITFLVLTLLGLERSLAGRHPDLWSIAAGFCGACMISTNLTLVALVPSCAVFWLVRSGDWRWRAALRASAFAAIGGGVALVLFGGLNKVMADRWLFLVPSIRFGLALYGQQNPWKTEAFLWTRAMWLVLPVVAGAGAVLSLALPPKGQSPFTRAVQASLLTALASWLVSDLAGNSALLQYFFYTSYLAPLALIALPLQAGVPAARNGLRAAVAIELGTLAILAVVYLLWIFKVEDFWHWWTLRAAYASPGYRPVVITAVTAVAGCLAVLSLRFIPRPSLRWAGFLCGTAVLFTAVPQYWPSAKAPDPRIDFTTVARAHRYITGVVEDAPVVFWYAPLKPTSPPFLSIASTYLWGWVLVNEELPHLTQQQVDDRLKPATRLVLLVNRQEEAAEARTAIRRFGLDYRVISGQDFTAAAAPFTVLITEVMKKAVP